MAAPRFLANIAGRIKMIVTIATSAGAGDAEKVPSTNGSGVLDATIINAKNTSAGAGDAGKIPQLGAGGTLDVTFFPAGIGPDVKSLVASETLAANDLVNVWNDGGVAKARKADATAVGKEANGFVLAGVASAATGTVYFDGTITGMSGLTPGARYYLSAAAAGTPTTTAPSAAANVVQPVGVAISATELTFESGEPIEVA